MERLPEILKEFRRLRGAGEKSSGGGE